MNKKGGVIMSEETKMSKEEQIGFHKGSLQVLIKERQELSRIVSIVDQLIQVHIGALKELGVDITKELGVEKPQTEEKPKKKKPIDEII